MNDIVKIAGVAEFFPRLSEGTPVDCAMRPALCEEHLSKGFVSLSIRGFSRMAESVNDLF